MAQTIIVLLLLLCGSVSADTIFLNCVVKSNGSGGGGDCLSATYMSSYDGDHSSGVDYICINSGASDRQASGNTADTVSTEYVAFNAANEYLKWSVSTQDIMNGSEGTIYLDFLIPTSATIDSAIAIIEWAQSSTLQGRIQLGVNGYTYGYHGAQNVGVSLSPSADTWYTIGYSWTQDQATGSAAGHSVKSYAAGSGPGSWTEQVEAVGNPTIDEFIIGEDYHTNSQNAPNGCRVRNVVVVSGYQSADPR